MFKKLSSLFLIFLLIISMAGCSRQNTDTKSNALISGSTDKQNAAAGDSSNKEKNVAGGSTNETSADAGDNTSGKMPDVEVHFGINSKAHILHFYDNNTAAELSRNIGDDGVNLPIYHFNDFDNYEVMQYYDLPSRFSIPSDPKQVTSEKAGEVYYSDPNRVILFYQDADIEGEYTKIGYIEDTDGLKEAVENNAVLEGWENKVILVNYKK